jgi:uncharacterized protein
MEILTLILSPNSSGAKMARMISFFRAYKRVIVLSLVFAYSAFLLVHPDEAGRAIDLLFLALFVMLIASQFFWIRRLLDLGERFIPGKPRRVFLAVVAGLVYLFFFIYNFPSLESTNSHVFLSADYRLHSVLIEAAYWWWFVGSQLAFLLVIAFGTADRATRATAWMYGKAREAMQGHRAAPKLGATALDPLSPARRRFLEQTAVFVSATPFVAAGYGLLYGRLDVEVVRQRIRLARLPKAFEGFRIAQLSDVHISPFMPADEIRRCVAITNQLKADLVVLTGDYITWDPEAEGQVVHALAGLRAPYGVFGCLGNHEEESEIEESITRLFAVQSIRILREERAPIRLRGETFNLIGIDCPRGRTRALYERDISRRLQGLVMPETVNILLSHYPDVFDRAAELGVDLTLAGHTHGGQLSLDFIYRGLNLSHLLYRYDCGWYEMRGAQLYLNRGIGTTGFPIRLGARPEITVLELSRLP